MEEEIFGTTYSEYINKKDKHESMYIFVIHNTTIESYLEKIYKMIGIIDDIQNTSKKFYLKTRLKNLISYLEGTIPETSMNRVFLLDNDVKEFELRKYWKDTLIMFKCDNILVKYGEQFNLEWLKDLLLNRSYIHVLHLKNNNLKHIHLNTTKKKINNEKEEKKMDIQSYITENIPKGEICIVHGVSVFLKTLKENLSLKLLI